MSEFLSQEDDPSTALALASSMAQRGLREQYWQQSVLAETVPLPPNPPIEVAQSIQTGLTVAILKSLECPDDEVDPIALVRTILDDKAIADTIQSNNEEPNEENINLLRSIIDGQVKTVWEHFDANHNALERMKDLLAAAENVSNEYSVDIHTVFSTDELYAECVRKLRTPQTYAEETAAEIEKVNQEFVLTTIENTVEAMLQAEIDSGEITVEEYATEKAEFMQDLLQDEESLVELEADLSAYRQAGQRLILRGIERFWGTQALDEFVASSDQRATEPAGQTPMYPSLQKQQRYNDIVATLCIENGWDPNRLTIEQMRQVSSSPQMQSFHDNS